MNFSLPALLILLSALSQKTNGLTRQDLGGIWRLQHDKKGYNLNVIVPGGIYTDLMKANIIDDVFYGWNDVKTRWVSRTNWNYSTEFTVTKKLLSHSTIKLIFDGIDTFSTIIVNDVEIDTTQNMFVKHIFDVKRHLKLGINQIQVNFESPINKAKQLFKEQSEDYSVVPLCVPDEYNGECHVNHIRKVQASFSWDWGPALPSVGIWKNVYLEAYNSAVLRDVNVKIKQSTDGHSWDVELYVYLEGNSNKFSITGNIDAFIATDVGSKVISANKISVEINENNDYLVILSGSVDKRHVKLWWPNGYGDANLYKVNVRYTSENGEEYDEKSFEIGFRIVELMQDKIESGRKFYFQVNGVPMFAKGANSIPINILPELARDEETIRFLLQSAKDVHMNLIRVWGGGNYEVDVFYELADRMGILIWQDFMFACNMYPATDEFLSNVKQEVKHQVRRLQHHASIALWAGNNENEAALRQNWYGTGHNFELFKRDYKKLYVETIQNEVFLNDDTRPYLVSSPTNGIQSVEEDNVAKFPQSNFYGDVHFYNYLNDSWQTSVYPISRFSSEYGYQALPSVNTLLTATKNVSNLQIGSAFLKHRQHLPKGYEYMDSLINFRLKLPNKNNERYHEAYVFYSQILQAMAVKIETEYNRQWRSILNSDGRGYTMGSLFWQLNDVWVAPTWSGIDFKNNWKMMHYFAKNFFAPVIITGDLTSEGNLDIYLVSDLTTGINNTMVTIYVYNWNSLNPVHSSKLQISIPPNNSMKIKTLPVKEYLLSINDAPCGNNPLINCLLYFTVTDGNNKITPDNYIFPVPLKHANVQKPNLKINKITRGSDPQLHFDIDIETNKIALFVWLEAKDIRGRFSENGFLQVVPMKTVRFIPEEESKLSEFEQSLSISHMMTF